MGASLSIINDLESSARIEVWTLGFGFPVTNGSVTPGKTLTLDGLGRVPYDVKLSLWRLGVQKVEKISVQLGPATTTVKLSEVFGPSVGRGQEDNNTVVYTPAGSEEDLPAVVGKAE